MSEPVKIAVVGGGYGAKVALPVYRELDEFERLDEDKRLWCGRAGEELRSEGPLAASSKDAFARVARNFRAAIRAGARPDPSLEEGLRVQALLDAVRAADAQRRWVEPEPIG